MELSQDDKNILFLHATQRYGGSAQRWKERAEKGLTDEELKEALSYEMGQGGMMTSKIELDYNSSGFVIRGYVKKEGKRDIEKIRDYPLVCSGNQSVKYARELYQIPYPDLAGQQSLF